MKSKRKFLLFLGIISTLILGIGIKAAVSDSSDSQSKIAYSESNVDSSQSSRMKESSSKKEKENKKQKNEKDQQVADESSYSKDSSKEPQKESKKNGENEIVAEQNRESVDKETGKTEEDYSSPQTESAPNKPVQQEEQIENKQPQNPVSVPQKPASPQPAESEKEDEDSVNQPSPPPETPVETPGEEEEMAVVMVSVTSDPAVRGTILADTAVEYEQGDTVLDVTKRILKQRGIQFGFSGSGNSAYVQGIDNLYEFDEGPMSGWHIRVNGAMIDRSAGAYPIEPGDSINWNYTTNYLED